MPDDVRRLLDQQQERQRNELLIRSIGAAKGELDLAERAVAFGLDVRGFEELLRKHARPEPPPTELPLSVKQESQYSLLRWALSEGKKSFESELSDEIAERLGRSNLGPEAIYVPLNIQRRDLNAATVGAGGAFVGDDVLSFLAAVRSRSIVQALGATVLTDLRGDSWVPSGASSATTTWLSDEASTATESQEGFDAVPITPKTVAVYVELSRKLLKQSAPSIEAVVFEDLGIAVAQALDTAAIQGTGSLGQPTGLLSATGIGNVSGASLAYADVLEFQADVDAAIEDTASLGWATTGAVARILKARHEEASTYSPIWTGPATDGRIDGYRAKSSSVIPDQHLIFGDWSKLVIGEWGVLQLERNPYANFQAGGIGLRAMYSLDVAIRRVAAFSAATNVT